MSWRGGGRGQRGGGAGDRGNTQPICYEFRNKGFCQRPNCRYSHDLGPNDASLPSAASLSTDSGSAQQRNRDQRICYFFKNGQCNKGANCRFSHDISEEQPAHNETAPRRVNESTEQKQARQTYNSWKSYLGKEPNNFRTMRHLWKGAQAILQEGDRDWKQQLPQDLATDDQNYKGYQHIGAILSRRVLDNDYDDFVKVCRDFLLTMTHPSLVDCLAVDTQVGYLFNYISGTNGSRAVPFFKHLCETLVALRIDDSLPVSVELLEGTLVALSKLLPELLRRNARVRFNNDLQTLTEALEAASKIFAPNGPNVPSTLVSNCVANVRALVARAKGLLATPGLNNDSRITAPALYPRDFVIPSDRHDNDKIDIADIIIFPTLDEIMSEAQEFLPFTDPDQPHFLTNPVERHIDTYFRLLRHEIFGSLKEALSCLMQELTHNLALFGSPRLKLGDVRAHQYTGAFISGLTFTGKKGLEVQFSFQQPSSIQAKSVEKQRQWWTDTKRLGKGSLLSFIWPQNATVQHVFLEVTGSSAEKREAGFVVNPDNSATVTVRIMTQDKPTLTMLMGAESGLMRGIILEFPKLMPATFVPILENLQGMQRLDQLPFSQWIVPSRHTEPSNTRVYHNIPPPLYARNPGFIFPLRSIVDKDDGELAVQPTSQCDDKDILDALEAKTPLDRGQCRALISALTREYAFIQGPPGTGKSYLGLHLMKVLLDVKAKAVLGPILVVCYTNHALDQFLEHLLDAGVEKLIRVGGQSKSERLKECNLNKLKRGETKTKSEKRMTWEAYDALETHEEEGSYVLHQLEQLRKRGEWSDLAIHLREDYPEIHSQFRDVDDEGFQHVGRHPFDMWKVGDASSTIASHHPRPVSSIRRVIRKAAIDAYSLTFFERQALVAHFVKEIHDAKVAELYETLNAVVACQVSLENVHAEASRRILEGADVIGMTTSGLAGKISLLKHVRCKVMICEEAGEILEPHMISALLPSVQHCIQIGDHEQLRPSVSNYADLSLESQRGKLHQLDKSQFERLSVGEHGRPAMPIAQLNVQRRMRPEISTLIRETIYDKLVDHATTSSMPDVVGLRKNVFWLDHNHVEDGMDADDQFDKSKTNTWEVAMIQALVHHVIRQGVYKSSEIAVLTPYTGQLQKLRHAMRDDFEIVLSDRDQEALEDGGYESDEFRLAGQGVGISNDEQKPLRKQTLINLLRVATVDNFQGEEAKVVIISLVRSNEKGKVGFLRSSNRINVLLSRAKHGMYIIGNTDTYANVTMWQEVIDILRTEQSVGQSLGLCCPRHPETIIDVQTPDDFEVFSPQGGCMEPCQDRLPCGHSCKERCHSKALHLAFSCDEPCQRLHQPCNHLCQKQTCGEDCGKCMVKLDDVQLPCGHAKNNVACHLTLNLGRIRCDVQVEKQVPGCEHKFLVVCSQGVTRADGFRCPISCGTLLPCSHPCPGTCGCCNTQDLEGSIVKHATCTKICGRKYGTCNHNCTRMCHDGTDCGLCHNPCEVRCKHTKCPLKCHEPCAPCIQPCVWECEHQGKCTMPCSAPCNRLPCNERCTKLLRCGHQCPSICGEECPHDYCQQCGMNLDAEPDMIMFQPYSGIDLDESPIVVLGCPHFFTIETLDGQIDIKQVYTHDEMTDQYTGLVENYQLAVNVPQCPHCRTPIRQYVTQRYNRVVNRAVMDEMSKRFIVNGQSELRGFEARLQTLEKDLESSREPIIPNVTIPVGNPQIANRNTQRLAEAINNKLGNRYSPISVLEQNVKACQMRMADKNQPATKLHEAMVYAIKKHPSIDDALAKLSLDTSAASAKRNRDQRVTFGFRSIQFKIRYLVLEDKYEVACAVRAKYPTDKLKLVFPGGQPLTETGIFLNQCAKLIKECTDESLPKFAVEATLYFSRITGLLGSSGLCKGSNHDIAMQYREAARRFLKKAAKLCEQPFQGAEGLAQAVEHSDRLLGREFYQEVSKEELEAIKQAMVSGSRGIATHSGHWYECVNGHPFAIGECGMPMEDARCPECGAAIGGQNHTAVEGVTRSTRMEG